MKLKFRTGKRETSEKCWTQIRRASVAVLQRRATTAKSTQRPHLHRPNIQRNGARPFKIMNRMPPNRRPLHRHPVQPGTTTSLSSLLRSIIRTKTLIFNQ